MQLKSLQKIPFPNLVANFGKENSRGHYRRRWLGWSDMRS